MHRQPDRVILSALATWMGVLGLLLVIGTASLMASESRLPTARAAARPSHPLASTAGASHAQVRATTLKSGVARHTSVERWSSVKGALDQCLRPYGGVMTTVERLNATSPQATLAAQIDATGVACGQAARAIAAVYQHGGGASHPEVLWLSHLAQTITIDMQRLHQAGLSHRSWQQTAGVFQSLARGFTPVQTFRAREGRWMRHLTAS